METAAWKFQGTVLSMTDKQLLVVDGTNLLYRSYHALASSGLEHAGRPIWAVHGLLNQLSKMLEKGNYTHMVVAFDSKGGCSYRKNLYPSYKANRPEAVDAITYQLEWAPRILRTCGISAIGIEDWEADDIIASCVETGEREGYICTVFSSDKDCIQLVSDTCVMKTPDDKHYDTASVESIFGCTPLGYRTIAALRGEPGDNLPGVKGIGSVTATKLANHFATFEDIFEADDTALRKVVSEKIILALRADREQASLTYKVAKLNRDLVVDVSLGKLQIIDRAHLKNTLSTVGLPSAGNRLYKALEPVSKSPF